MEPPLTAEQEEGVDVDIECWYACAGVVVSLAEHG